MAEEKREMRNEQSSKFKKVEPNATRNIVFRRISFVHSALREELKKSERHKRMESLRRCCLQGNVLVLQRKFQIVLI
jgi:hypothetical protein